MMITVFYYSALYWNGYQTLFMMGLVEQSLLRDRLLFCHVNKRICSWMRAFQVIHACGIQPVCNMMKYFLNLGNGSQDVPDYYTVVNLRSCMSKAMQECQKLTSSGIPESTRCDKSAVCP
jgi:hypothetical protein